ncbi:ribose-5-phosphate isomerase RpiA [Virgibacillus sp. NKC19-16]|uniref:ribose-5-phosphate isomerase RpiA n=1 Tax=Virgibacillus salidurans TaxID=2831673 RepID=UPI001F4359C0|nr:ribose-5-phosphate isomerase RpiA [Virgibacillus sp. NKC19-16]UJL45571.1 ribose-5-phosphate isomerase RpiA [Virgibacillus sp. NKC19-16]
MNSDKKVAGEEAVSLIKNGMTIGLGSGSTVNWMLKSLSKRVKEGLDIKGIPSSQKTERLAIELGVPLTDFSNADKIDIAVDGADEVDSGLNLLKGGGGSLVREKIIDAMAKELVVIVDQSKVVSHLGEFSLPVEVIPFGWGVTSWNIADLGGVPSLRKKDGSVFVSDNGNYILDCKFGKIDQPKNLHEQLKLMVGVVETGLFVEMTDKVIVARNGGIEILS